MIELQNVSKSYWDGQKRNMVLNGVDFKVEQGENLGILTLPGQGKTTLIKIMGNLMRPDEGRVIRTSRVSFPLTERDKINKKQSARANCRSIARLYGMDPDYTEALCRYICDFGDQFGRPLKTLPEEAAFKVSVAILCSMDFDLYLIDTTIPAAKDQSFNARAGQILHEKLTAATCVFVGGNSRALHRYANRYAILNSGFFELQDSQDMAVKTHKQLKKDATLASTNESPIETE